MTGKRKAAKAAANGKDAADNRLQLTCLLRPNESNAQAGARFAVDPAVTASRNLIEWTARNRPFTLTHAQELVEEFGKQAEAVGKGDLSRPEAILISQAHTLDTMFNDLSQIARQNLSSNLEAFDKLLRLALRAQTQCRATIETLAEIKNPTSPTFVRQANIAHGPQQVNNAPQTTVARSEETKITPSKLLEQTHGEGLDFGTAGQAVGSHPAMATVGAIDGATHG